MQHKVKEQECLGSLSVAHGFAFETLRDLNREHLHEGAEPFVLRTGAMIDVPERSSRSVDRPSDQRHVFRRKQASFVLRLCLRRNHRALASLKYRLSVEGEVVSGTTDAEGRLAERIPGTACSAILELEGFPGEIRLSLGRLEPVSDTLGLQDRLANLGYYFGPRHGRLDPATRRALADFQSDVGVERTGEMDAEVCDRLRIAHGC